MKNHDMENWLAKGNPQPKTPSEWNAYKKHLYQRHACKPSADDIRGLEIAREELREESENYAVVPGNCDDDLIEALDNTTAALETLLAHFGPSMPAGDLQQRSRIALAARAAIANAKEYHHADQR